jgi:integrase
VGLRDRALIGLMVFSFARIGAALGMKVEDVFTQNRRLWVRPREKGGKGHAMPCHHNLETYLTACIDGAGLAEDPRGPLFRTIGRGTGLLTRTPLPHANAYEMIRRRGRHHGISKERRDAGEGGADGEPCQYAHDAALRPPARGTQPRRGGED